MGDEVGNRRSCAADADGLEAAAEHTPAEETAFERAEEGKGEEGDKDGEAESGGDVVEEHVGDERDEAAGDVGEGDGERGAMGLVGRGFFEAEFEAHHEVDPGGRIGFEGGEDGLCAQAGNVVLLKDLVDLFFLVPGAIDDLALFAEALGAVVLGVSAGGEISAQAHGDGAGGDLGETGQDDEARGGDGSGESGREGEGDGEPVGQADDDVADGLAGLEVLLLMRMVVVVSVRRVTGLSRGGI